MSNQCQNNGCYYPTRRMVNCWDWALGLFAWLFALALGIILGAVFYETFVPILATIIVFAVIMVVGIIALLIYRGCAIAR